MAGRRQYRFSIHRRCADGRGSFTSFGPASAAWRRKSGVTVISKPQMRDNQGSRAMPDATLSRRDMLWAVGALTVDAAFAEPPKAAAAEPTEAGPEPTSWVDSTM